MKYCAVILSLLLALPALAQNRRVCFTIDDLPVVSYGIGDIDYWQQITQDLLATFAKYEIPAIGFVNESKLYRHGVLDSSRVALLAMWLRRGYELGNHTYSHMDYHRAPLDAYAADIKDGERITRPLAEEYDQPYRYFRHPYLRIGLTKAHHDSLRQFLREHHYVEAPVTIDNNDYIFAKAYHNARVKKDTATMEKIGKDYLAYMEDKLLYFERASEALETRNINHILLLHANKLNADYLDELAAVYRRHQYQFISLEKALADEAYQQEIPQYDDWGISWIDRWALSRGKTDFLKEDPVTPPHIIELSGLK